MGLRAAVRAGLLCILSLLLSNCAKKHHVNAAVPRTPAAPPQIVNGETGFASWYGHPYHGRAAANGQIYDMEKLTAAHRTLPFGTWVRVTNLSNEKTVDVRIIDRGPFVDGRIIDLSHAAAQVIDLIGPGVAQVRLDIISTPIVTQSDSWYAVQAGAFQDKDRAERLRIILEQRYGNARLVPRRGDQVIWRVLVGRERTQDGAYSLATRVRNDSGAAFVVRLDDPEYPTPGAVTSPMQQ